MTVKIESMEVYGFQAAFRGMRNARESWAKSDSTFWQRGTPLWEDKDVSVPEVPIIGAADLKLACTLVRAGKDHRKFLRQIGVWMDLTIPRYVWTEFDTYKVGTVRNSTSTMNKLGSRDLTRADFADGEVMVEVLERLNHLGRINRNASTKSETVLRLTKLALPESFLQLATVSLNYEVALSMYLSRQHHRLPEWSGPNGICSWLLRLPYLRQFAEAALGLRAA